MAQRRGHGLALICAVFVLAALGTMPAVAARMLHFGPAPAKEPVAGQVFRSDEETATATSLAVTTTTPTVTQTLTLEPNLLPHVSGAHVLHTPSPTQTPTTTPTPSATPKPWDSVVSVGNHTGSQLCYEVYGTGIGRKCFAGGEHLYGAFQTGSYVFFVEMRCGAAELPWHFPGGRFVHDFWCPAPPVALGGAFSDVRAGTRTAPLSE